MNFIKGLVISSMAIAAASAEAEEEASVKHGRWTVHAGYAWRAQAKTDFSGSAPLPPAACMTTASSTAN